MSPGGWRRLWLGVAGVSGAIAMMAAARSAHGLDQASGELADKAAHLQLVHSLALLAIAAIRDDRPRWRNIAAGLFVLGILAFCGGLYAMAFLGAPATPLIPVGGTAFILGWLALVVAAFAMRGRDP